ncbi:MAG TPA: tRNA lysidine(34) synthetase TilS [Flavobacterium sp.]|nr:tRNA lysidine(34) synthetase TilS [Flavobacterium sp.]
MLEKFQKYLSQNLSFLKDKKLLLAISGGVDSMVMAELFKSLGYDISIAHCNFNLRGSESDSDTDFVKNYAGANNLKIHITHFDTNAFAKDNKLSIQLAARQLRYLWFQELLEKYQLNFVLTAHHADDNLETFLINFSRGTGIEGLTGIPQQNGNIIRPLLVFSRSDIENFANENGIGWREDSSNASDKYLRNKIRHDIVPALKSLNPNFIDAFNDTSNHLQQAKSMVDDASVLVRKEVVIEKEDKLIFKIFDLKRLPNYQAYLYQWLKDFGFTAWDDIYDLVDAQSGKQIHSEDFILLKDREILILTRKTDVDKSEAYWIDIDMESIKVPINLSFCRVADINETANDCIFVDADKLNFPLQIRKWNEGDYFYPFGMEGKKKIAKYFKDEKIPLTDKSDIWILLSGNEIVWIINKRMDNRFRVTENTTNRLQIKTS